MVHSLIHVVHSVIHGTLDWNNEEPLLEMMANEDFICTFEDNIHQDEPLLQVGRGQKRSINEANNGAGTSNEVSGNKFFTMTDVNKSKLKSSTPLVWIIWFNLRTRSSGTFRFHNRLHEIFENY